MANNAAKREEAREKARLLMEQQAKRDKRNKGLMVGGVVVLLGLVAGLVWTIVSWGNQPVIAKLEKDQIPANTQVEDGGIPVGATLAAGSTNEGAPVIDVYLDYTCSYCIEFEKQHEEYLEKAAGSGDATIVFHPVAIMDHSGNFSGFSGRATAAIAAVADRDPKNFVEAHKALLGLGEEYLMSQGQQEADAARITEELVAAGVAQDVAEAATQGVFRAWVQATTQQFGKDGIQGTPTIRVNGEDLMDWTEPGALEEAVKAAKG